MTQPVRQVIDAALDSWLHDDDNRAPTRTDAILASFELAGIGTYDTRTHAVVPRVMTERIALAFDAAPCGMPDDVTQSFWQPSWEAAIAAAEAEAREAGDE